jgi:hypothetical protein
MSVSLVLLGSFFWGCTNSGLDRPTPTGDTGDDGGGGRGERCPFEGEWQLEEISCFSFPYDAWYDSFEKATMEIEADGDGGCDVVLTLEGPDCEQEEEWHFDKPVGAEVEVTYEGISDCTPNQCEFDDDIATCDKGQHVGEETLNIEASSGELIAGGLLQHTTPNCESLSTTWEKN